MFAFLLLSVVTVHSFGVLQDQEHYHVYLKNPSTGALCGLQTNALQGSASGLGQDLAYAKVDCNPDSYGETYRADKAGTGGWLLTEPDPNASNRYKGKCGLRWALQPNGDQHAALFHCTDGAKPVYILDTGLHHIHLSKDFGGKACGLRMLSTRGPGMGPYEYGVVFDCSHKGDDVSFDLKLKNRGLYKVYNWHYGYKCGLRPSRVANSIPGVGSHEKMARWDCEHHGSREGIDLIMKLSDDRVHYTMTTEDGCGLQMAKVNSEASARVGIGATQSVAKFDCNGKADEFLVENGEMFVKLGDKYCGFQAHHPARTGEAEHVPGLTDEDMVAKFDCKRNGNRLIFEKQGRGPYQGMSKLFVA